MKGLSDKQRAVLAHLARPIAETDSVPSFAEIGRACGLTRQGAYYTIHALRKKGFVDDSQGAPRVSVALDVDSMRRARR